MRVCSVCSPGGASSPRVRSRKGDVPPPCTSSSWDAAVSARRCRMQLAPLDHTIAVIDQDPARVPPARRRLPGPAGARHRLRPRDPDRGGHRAGRRLRRGQQRRQLEHHLRAGRARDLRRATGRRPHLRPATRRGLRAAGHPHGRHRAVDVVPAAQGGARRDDRRGVARPVRRRRARSRSPRTRAGSGSSVADFESATGARAAIVTRFGSGQLPLPSTIIQAGDKLHVLATDEHARDAARPSPAAPPRGCSR